jgi:Domain of unknown function (DUF5655)
VQLTLDDVLADASPHAVDLYRAVEAAVRNCGAFRIHAQKTRIAFITAMSFAGVGLAERWVDLSLITPEPIGDDRIARIELYGPTSFANTLRIHRAGDVDADVRGWLSLAYRRGLQETLDPGARVSPVIGIALQRLRVPVAATVAVDDGELALRVPRYAAQALADQHEVLVRVLGSTIPGEITPSGMVVADLGSVGLGEGDRVDVSLTADR